MIPSQPGSQERLTRLRTIITTLATGFLLATSAHGQIAYTEDFNGCNSATCNGWTAAGGAASISITSTPANGYTPCASASAKGNLYETTGWFGTTYSPLTLTSNSSLGVSNGQLATLMFDYGCVNYGSGTAASANAMDIIAQWGTSASGPWTTISTFGNVSSASCVSSGALNFTPPTSSQVYIRLTAEYNSGDVWAIFDNITLDQAAPPGCNTFPPPVPSYGPQYTPSCTGSAELVASGMTGGDQNHVYLTAGQQYEFSSTVGSDYLTVADAVGLNTLAAGNTPLLFTASTTGTHSVWVNTNSSCGTGGGPRDLNVNCTITYCNAGFSNQGFEYISNVNFAGIDNTTAGSSGLNDYTAQVANVSAGATYPISITIDPDADDYIYVFIDWNHNGTLDDAGEVTTVAGPTDQPGPHTVNISVPGGAYIGTTLMRVMVDWDNATPDPCRNDTYGEVEDYTVNVLSCSQPSATATPDFANCPTSFDIDVEITDVGDGPTTTLEWTLNAVPQTAYTGLVTSDVVNMGPFANSDVVELTLVNVADNACNISLGSYTGPTGLCNDDCAFAQPLTVHPDGQCPGNGITVNNAAATASGEALTSCDFFGTNLDLFYTFVAPISGQVIITATNVSSGTIEGAVKDACGGTELYCSTSIDGETVGGLTPGNTYYLQLWTDASGGEFQLCLNAPPPPPANDLCANAIPLECNSVTNGTTTNSTAFGAPPGPCGSGSGFDQYAGDQTAGGVWYTVEGWDGTMTVNMCASSYDTRFWVGTTPDCVSYTCVEGNDDAVGGVCGLQSLKSWAATSGTTYYIYVTGYAANTGDFELELTCSDQIALCPVSENTVQLQLTTDANGGETSYGIEAAGLPGTELCSGSGLPSMSTATETCCLPDGCYRVRVYDSGNDGIVGGGYVVRDGNGERIIDNEGNFTTGGESSMSDASMGARYFCLPLGNDRLIYTHCDKEDFEQDDFVIASANAAVNAEYGGPNAGNSGYVFSIFNPNGNYMRYAYYTHANPAVGAPAGPSAAQHLRHNGWFTLPVPGDELMNVRVRSVVAGVASPYGPVCRYMWQTAQPTCPLTQLVDNPNNSNHSCDVTRTQGTSDKLVAWNVPGATGYVFKFDLVGEVDEWNLWSNTNALLLNWDNDVLGLTLNAPYLVSVSAYVDGSFCPFGPECPVTLLEGPMAQNRELGVSSAAMELYPNPNRGDNVNLSLNELPEDLDEVSIEIHDAFGKRVHAQTIAQPGNSFTTVLELDGNLSNGIYMVSVIIGQDVMTQKLTVQ